MLMTTTRPDLAGYLRRIDHRGPCRPDRATLDALVAAQLRAIPFENTDVLAGRVPRLDLAALQAKLLVAGRGGYCYEQNSLLLAMLREIGFDAEPLEARVRIGLPVDVVTGRTHMAVRVRIDGEALLADAGLGGVGPMAAVPFDGESRRGPDGGVHRLTGQGVAPVLQLRTGDGWTDCYELGPSPPQQIDLEMGNWYVATHPKALLGNNLLVSRAVDGGRLTLFNRALSFRRASTDTVEERLLDTPDDIVAVLTDRLGVILAPADIAPVMAKLPL